MRSATCARRQVSTDRAIAAFNKAIELGGRSVNHISVLAYAYGRSGNRDRATALLEELTTRASKGHVSAMWIAMVHLGLSDLESLFHWLDRAFEERDGSLILITAAVEFDSVREDPRFKSLLGRMGLGYLASSSEVRVEPDTTYRFAVPTESGTMLAKLTGSTKKSCSIVMASWRWQLSGLASTR